RTLHARLANGGELKILDPHQNETVVTIAEMIIPATDTPGATAAKVNEFIDLVLGEWFDANERKGFLDGLAEVDARSRKRFGKDFTGCTPEQQTELLELLDAEVAALRDADRQGQHREPGPSQRFFGTLKRFTLLGYFTSEVGVTEELHNPIIPGRYDGCVPLEQRGK
ncbi:MAG TPA: gluconate 2-dehydrogenase subunit 3 family protein, partial [Gemmatimonadales bacterium]|nr:gluconate 2-dehydrogenase subunit 3 family protein [Gemmatimonadales bacterium]